MINFSELPADGIAFEQLCRELLTRLNFDVHWTGVGQDSGRDLIIIEKVEGTLAPFERTWLVSCKHKSSSNKAVGMPDFSDTNIVDDCRAANATGFLLMCSTHPSSQLVKRLEEISSHHNIVTSYWDSVELTKRLNTPETLSIVHMFLPEQKHKSEWNIYNALTPSLWAANYKGYFFYMESRTDCVYPSLNDIEVIIDRINNITLPTSKETDDFNQPLKHYLRPRLIFFDNKAGVFSVYLDYLYPDDEKYDNILHESVIEKSLDSGRGLYKEGNTESTRTYYNLRSIGCNQISDHFHPDHKEYYLNYIKMYH